MTASRKPWLSGGARVAVLAILSVACLACSARALTLAEMRTQIRRNVRDTSTDTTLQTFSNAVILSYVNEAQKEINAITWSDVGFSTVALVAGTSYYTLPDNFLAMSQVTWTRSSTGVTLELKEDSERHLIQTNPDFERMAAGPPINYFTRQSITGGNAIQIGLVPAPASTSLGTLNLQYIIQPADLSSDSDVAFDGLLFLAPYHNLIVYYVSGKLTMIRGRTDESTAYTALYNAGIQLMSQRVGQRPNYNPGAVGGTPGR